MRIRKNSLWHRAFTSIKEKFFKNRQTEEYFLEIEVLGTQEELTELQKKIGAVLYVR